MDLAQMIKQIREGKSLRQADIAEELGMDTSNYSRLEKRGVKLTLEQVTQIARAMDVPVEELLLGHNFSNPQKEVKDLKIRIAELKAHNEICVQELQMQKESHQEEKVQLQENIELLRGLIKNFETILEGERKLKYEQMRILADRLKQASPEAIETITENYIKGLKG